MSTHSSQHSHFSQLASSEHESFALASTTLVQQSMSNHHVVELTFKFRWYLYITQGFGGKPSFHLHCHQYDM